MKADYIKFHPSINETFTFVLVFNIYLQFQKESALFHQILDFGGKAVREATTLETIKEMN